MKKIIAFVMCALMIFGMASVVLADDGDATATLTSTPNKTVLHRGDTLEVVVAASGVDGLVSSLGIRPDYSADIFEFDLANSAWLHSGVSNAPDPKGLGLGGMSMGGVDVNTDLAVLKFTVKADAAFGETTIATPFVAKKGSTTYTFNETPATVTIECQHNWEKDGDTVAATCGAEGYTNYKCTVCGETKKDDIVPATGNHTVGSVLNGEQVQPTCTTDGKSPYMCSVCGQKIENPIPALGHDWFELEDEYVEPTYTTEGKKVFVCTRCDEQKEEVIPVKTVEVIIVVDGKEIAKKDVTVIEKDGKLYIVAPEVEGYTAKVAEVEVVIGEDGVIAPVSIEYTPNAVAANPADDNKTPADSNNNKPASNNPPMGDNMIFVVIALAVVACASAAVLVVRRRKTNR